MKTICPGKLHLSTYDFILGGEHEPLEGVCIIGAEAAFDYKQDAVLGVVPTRTSKLLVCKHCWCVYVSLPEVGEINE